jgi:hypothetical protein
VTVSQVVKIEDVVYRPYTPKLALAEVHLKNHYRHIVSDIVELQRAVIDENSFVNYSLGFIKVYAHVINRDIYNRVGVRSDSLKKFEALVFGTGAFPRFLLDLAREIARPMYFNHTVFYPVFTQGDVVAKSPMGFQGITASNSSKFSIGVGKLYRAAGYTGPEPRPIAPEDVRLAPLYVHDGDYSYYNEDVASWRKSAQYVLQHVVNGSMVDEPPNNLAAAAGEGINVIFAAVSEDADLQVRQFEQAPREELFDLPGDAGGALVQATVLAAIVGSVNAVVNGVQYLWLFWVNDRQNIQNDWLGAGAVNAHLPRGIEATKTIRILETDYPMRFPTSESHSRSPRSGARGPQGTIRQDART